MATNQTEREMGGEIAEGDQLEETYEQKFQEMQKYIPFLEMMIQRLERSSDKSREAQLLKMKSLLSILSNTKKKLKISTLKRCEDVLQKLHDKVEKGTNAQTKPSAVKPEEKVTSGNSQESSNSEISDSASAGDGNEQNSVTVSTADSSVTNIMNKLRLAAARTSVKNVLSAVSCPANDSDREGSRDDHVTTTASSVDKISLPEKKSKALDVLEQSRERLKKLMEQQTLSSTESGKKVEGHTSSLSVEWQCQTDPPWEKQDNEKRALKSVYLHNTGAGDPVEGCSKLEHVKDISSSEGPQYYDDHYHSVDISRPLRHDESCPGWSDYKPPTQFVWHPDSERHGNTVPNKPSLSPTGINMVPTSPHSPTSTPSGAPNTGRQTCTSPVKRALPQFPALYNVLKHPPAAGTKPLSDADIEELLEDTKRCESEPEKKEEPTHMSLRAKLEQEIQQVHRVGVSKGGALRSLVQKDEKLKSPVKNIVDIMKPNSEPKKDRLATNRQQALSKSDSITGSALKVSHDKEKGNDISQSTHNSQSHFAEKGDNKNDFGNANETVTKPAIKDKRPTDPRRHAGFSPRREESCQNSSVEDVHPSAGDKNCPRLRIITDAKSNFDDSSSNHRDLSVHGKLEGSKKEGAGILSSLSKEELQKIVEENLRNLPSPPPNTKEILETVNMNSPSAMKSSWQQSTDFLSPHPSSLDYNNQSGFMSSLHSSQYGSQAESHLGNGRNSAPYSSPFGISRPEDRSRGLLPTPNIPHDPRIIPRNINQDPRCSRDNQGLSNIHDPRLNTSNYPHHDNFRSGISQHTSHDQYMRPVPSAFHQNSRTHFHTSQTPHLQASSRWGGSSCYGVLSHNSPRPPDESFVLPEDNYPHHGANSSRFQCSPHSSQHEFRQIHPLRDQFSDQLSGNNQQHPPWQSPPSSQGFRSGSSADYPSSVRSVGQPVQHHGNSSHGASKIPIGDPRLCNQFTGHRSPVTPQNTTSAGISRSSGATGTHAHVQSTDSRSASTLSERDPRRRRSIEEPEKRDCSSRNSRDSRKISSNSRVLNYGCGSERVTDRRSSNERKRESDSRKLESSSNNRKRSSPEPNNPKETELVSPLNSLYDVATVPKTGKGYGFQKFRIPKLKRPPSPPKSKSPPPPKAKSPPPNVGSSHICDTKEKAELVKSSDETQLIETESVPCSLNVAASNDVSNNNATSDDKINVECAVSKDNESALPEKSSDIENEKISSGSRSKEEVTQEWIEALIRKSFESGEGKKFIEQAKLLEKLGESLKGKKLRKIKQILESDSDSESDDSVLENSKEEEESTSLNKEDQKVEEKEMLKMAEMCRERSKKSKYRRVILSDDDQSTDSETLASRLKKEGTVEADGSFGTSKGKDNLEKEDKSNRVEEGSNSEKEKQSTSTDDTKPVKKYSKRRSALELLQEDIRDMFICEGVVTATGHRMCRLLKETPPGMTVDEISKSTVKGTEEEVSTAAEESDGSSVCKRRSRQLVREKGLDKKGREEKVDRKQKIKVRMKDKDRDCEFETVSEVNEKVKNSRVEKKDDIYVDETDRSCSPVTRPLKKYEKCKWKGYVIEESEDSNEDLADNKKERTEQMKEVPSCDKPPEQSYSHGRTRSKLNPTDDSETSSFERGRRTRLPRVILEKADFSKLSLVSSKPRTRYFEDSSSDGESVMEDSTLSPVCSIKSKFKVVRKSRAKAKHVYHKRGRRCVSKRGRKKCLKVDRNDEVSTDVESIVSDQSSVASTVSHQKYIEDTCSPIGFMFRRKCSRKRSKLLGQKIDDIIKRLTKGAGVVKVTSVMVGNTVLEGKPYELGKKDSSAEEAVTEIANAKAKEEENIVKPEDTFEPSANESDSHLAKRCVKTESNGASGVGRKRNSRLMLNLVRKFGMQKKIKKKKTKWQLGIINSTKKKGGIKMRAEGGTKDVISSAPSEKEVNELNKAVNNTNTDECSNAHIDEREISTKEHVAEDGKLVNRKQNTAVGGDNSEQKIDKKLISELEGNRENILVTSDICVNKSASEVGVVLGSEEAEAGSSKSPTVVDRSYVLDGSAKYVCKLCSVECKSIVSHYKNFHQDSEVLISRLSEEEATQAIAEACESNYKEDEGNAKPGKRTRKQAGKFICRVCDYNATYTVDFYEHLSSHTGEYRFKCGQCSYEAPTRRSIKGHFYYHHPELKGVDGVNATVLAPGPSNDAKFVFGYLCLLCNYIQLLKHNTERHISLMHTSESNTQLICINMSKTIKTPNDIAEGELNNVCTDEGTNESSDYIGEKVSLGDQNICDENMCNLVSPVMKTEIIPEEAIERSSCSVTRIIVTEQEYKEEHTDVMSKPSDTVDESCVGKERTSETEPLGAVCVTQSENCADSCTSTSVKLSDVTVVGEKPDTVFEDNPDTVSQELSALNSANVAIKAGYVELSSEVAKEDLLDVQGRQMKQKTEGSVKIDAENTDITIASESSTSGAEEAVKEVDLKAFVCSDDLEEENSVIQKERLKKMQEIAKNLKDSHPQFLQFNRSSILDHLSDKLKTGFKSKTVDTTIAERNIETVDSVTHNKESENKGSKSQAEMLADVSTLIDEKRAIEAAQAVQNLLRAEKQTFDREQSPSICQKITDSFSGNRSGRHTKPYYSDTLERRITRSFSKNEDDVDIEGVDESSSDISFGFDGEDNDEIAEFESQSPETLLNETLSALKDVGPKKSRTRMFDIIERLASKVVPKTEPADVGEHVVEMGILKPHSSVIDTVDNTVCSDKEIGLETNGTGCLKNVINKKSSGEIGKPPPLISLGAMERNMLRSTSGIENEGAVSSVRVGPLEVRRFSDGLLYSCCIRGCIFASTNRMSFASHIELTHKVSRWDGSCKACNNQAKGDRPLKLSHALHHLIEFHLVASPNDLTTSTASNGNEQDIVMLPTEKTHVEETEVLAQSTGMGGGEMSTEQSHVEQGKLSAEGTYVIGEDMTLKKSSVEQGKMLTENTSVGEGENCNRKEGATEACAPRKFIRLRRLSGDLLSIPKPAEDPVLSDAQQQPLHKDDTELNQLITEWGDEEASNNEDCGPFLKIESVVSLNPEAMGAEDVNEILKAVEDPQNASKSSDSGDCSNVVTSSPTSSFCAAASSAVVATSIVESSIQFMTTTAGSSTNVLQTASPDVQLLSSPQSSSSSALPVSVLRGKTPLPAGTMHMIPVTQLPKSSTITILPSLQPITPVKLSNVQLSPVKLANFKSPDVTSKPSVSTNIPHSLVGLAQITRPTNSKITVAKERLSTGVVGGGVWCNHVLPNLLPKGTFVRLEIKDNQITTKPPVVLTTKSQAPVTVNVKAAPSVTVATKTTSSVPKVPISSVSVMKGLEVQVPAKIPQKGRPSSGSLPPPPVPVTPASNTVLTTVIPKNKLPHKSAVAPSYAKACKVPSAYQEMIKPAKLRHLYKCMGKLCSYTTDSMESFAKHYNEHESQVRQHSVTEKKRGRPPASKMSEYQQCAYCCDMQTSLGGVLQHIQSEHAHCVYQCAYCFYRAVTKSYIILHQNTSHTSEKVAVLLCKDMRSQFNPVSAAKCRSIVVVPYVCEQGSCGATFYIPDSFLHHLEKEHSQLAIYSCHICSSKSFKPDRLLAHYRLHSCCFYQCMYCLHGTDTKEEMHHHLCNFHSNQAAKVIIRTTNISENAVLRGSRNEKNLLEALDVLDLDEGLSDDGVLILPPSEKEQTSEDAGVTHSELQESTGPNITDGNLSINTAQTTKEVALDDGMENAVSAISSEVCNIPNDLLFKELTKETNKPDDTNTMRTSDSVDVVGSDDKLQNHSPPTSSMENKTDDDIVVIDDDGSGAGHGSDHDTSGTQPVQPIPQQNSHAISEVCVQRSGTDSSQPDSDVECIVKPGTSQQESKDLNGTRESDVIVLDSTTDTESEGTEIMGKDLATKENMHLILHEPLVTVKHRNPKTSAEIEAAVDPLSLELSQSEGETSNVTSALQSTSSISLCAENSDLDSENINSVVSRTETGLNESGATGVEDDDVGLSGSTLYQCGYVTCTFTAEDSSLLKDHLLVCDLARASSSLTCVHCKKQFKYVASLIEHLRTHGIRRFSCALCSFRAPAPQQVAKHLKQRHRVGSTRISPLHPLRTDPETAMFVVFPKDKGRGGRKGSGKDTQDVRSKLVFLPEEVEILPRQAIYTRPVRCATCSYTTKVRSNMARHLHLHLTSNIIPDVMPPNNAPVNPVPCLEKKEMMFDKMTNLAASSHIAAGAKASETPSGSLTLTEELEAKLPKFVPEHQRYVCGAPGCSYLTCDETMLRYHLRALHFDEPYRCPHCSASNLQENTGQVISIERMGAHLKMHDSRLYKCAHCLYHHFQRYVVERHLADKHPEKRPFVHVVREPEMEPGIGKTEAVAGTSLEGAISVGAGVIKNPWHCGLCKFRCSTRSEVLEHTWGVHGLKSQFKCGLCSYRSSSKASFDAHFGSKHPAAGNVELIHVYFKVDAPQLSQSPAAKSGFSVDIGLFDTTPLWRRDMQRVRHIRGILLEEEGDIPKPDIVRRSSIDIGEMEETEGKFGPYGKPAGNLYMCTLCNKYRTKFKADFRDHLYRELSYHKWVCTHCSLMSCNKSTLQKHSAKVHDKDRKPEAIAPLTPNKEIEEWVDKVINTQLAVMKAEQHTTSGESAGFSSKTSAAGLTNLSHAGPSGLSGRGSKAGHAVPGSSGKVSVLEKEDVVVLGSSCGDSDLGTSKKKVPVVQDMPSASPVDGKTYDGSLYTKMQATDEVKLLRFPCKHCNMKFAQIRGLKVHIRHNHLKLSIWTCGYCGYVANSEESVLNHSKSDHPDLPPRSLPHTKGSCVKLDDEFWQREYGLGQGLEPKYSSLSIMTQSSSASSSPISSPLKKRQRSASPSDESERSPSLLSLADQSVNKCMYCDYCCRSASDLKYHVMRHWVQKPFKCGYCDFEGVREYEIKKHLAKIHPLKKLRIIEKPMPTQPDIRPLQRNKRSKPDSPGSSSDVSVNDMGQEKKMQCDEPQDTRVSIVRVVEDEQQNTIAVPNLFCCFYCPQRGTSVVSIHQHWQEKHKNKQVGPNGVIRLGLPFKYKEVNMKQFLKGKNAAAGRRPAFQCSYCKVRGTLSALEAHQKTVHSDRPFRVSEARLTHYECAECHYIAFTVNTLKKHFEMDHAGIDLRYLVRSSKASTVSDVKGSDLPAANKSAVNLGLAGPSSIVTAKYMCLWCEETCDSEDTIQVHHAMCHSHLQLRYSVEKSNTPAAASLNIGKKYSCPSCTFMSDSSQGMSEHLQCHYVKPCKTDCKASDLPNKNDNLALVAQAEEDCEVIHIADAEKQSEELRSDSEIFVAGDSGVKYDPEAYDIPSSPKRLCVARKSTTLSPRIGKFHSVARKSTTPLPSQGAKKAFLESYDVEQGDTSAPSSRSESPVTCSEFSYYGTCPAPVDTNRITASVKLQNNLGVNMNVSLATMEKFTNLYPVVKVKDLKYEKWGFL